MVLATQNPIENEGTYPLPEAQLDRFMLKVRVGYPTRDEEKEVLLRMSGGQEIPVERMLEPGGDPRRARGHRRALHGSEGGGLHRRPGPRHPRARQRRAGDLKPLMAFGGSPRASIALAQAARAHAFLRGRDYVVPEDVRALAPDVLRHRIVLTFEAEAEDMDQRRRGERRCWRRCKVPECREAPSTILPSPPKSSSRSKASSSAPGGSSARSSPASTARCSAGRGWSSPRCAPTSRATTSGRSTGTCRRGSASPYVKTFTEERELTLMLLVDQSGSTRFGEPVTKASLAVEVAAVLALAAAYQNDRVGALLFADEVERVIPPRKGRRHALRVIRDLVAFEPAGRRTNLGRQPLVRQPAAPAPQHRGGPLRFHRARGGSGRCGGWRRGTRWSPSRWTIRASTSCPSRAGSRCWTRNRAGACWWTPAAARCGRGWASSRSSAARSAAGRSSAAGRRPGAPGHRRPVRAAAPARLRPPRAADPPRMIDSARSSLLVAAAGHRDGAPDRRRYDLGHPHGGGPGGCDPARGGLGCPGADRALGPPQVTPHGDSADVSYPIVVWRTGPLARRGPRPAAARRRRASRFPARTAAAARRRERVARRRRPIPALAPQPRADFVPRTSVTVVPLWHCCGLAALLLAPLHWWWRRRGRRGRVRCRRPARRDAAARALGGRRRIPRRRGRGDGPAARR